MVATVAVDVTGQARKKCAAATVMVRASILAADVVDQDPNSGPIEQGERIMEQAKAIRLAALEALAGLLGLLGHDSASRDPEALKTALQRVISQGGGYKAVTARCGFSNDERSKVLVSRMYDMADRTRDQDSKADDLIANRNAVLAQLRVLVLVENIDGIRSPKSLLDLETVTAASDEERARRQARAIELIIRSLITERYVDQDRLILRLRELFKEEVVQSWLSKADKGDVLSGAEFSRLATLFVDPKEFADFKEKLFEPSPFLTLLRDKRKTIADFLNDIREVRNALAHHKKLGSLQVLLLDKYFDEIVTPIQNGFDRDQTGIDPKAYLSADANELNRFFDSVKEDIQDVRDSVAELSEDLKQIDANVEKVQVKVDETNNEVRGIGARLRKHGGLILVAVVLTAATLGISLRTLGKADDFGKKIENVKKETSDDPKKELANRGIPWKVESLEEAVRRGDVEAIKLFKDGGMDPMDADRTRSSPIAALLCHPDAKQRLEQIRNLGIDITRFYSIDLGKLEYLGHVVTEENLLAGHLRACQSDDPELAKFLVENGVKLERDYLEKAGATQLRLPRRLEYAPFKPKTLSVLLEANAIDLSVRDGELISFMFIRNSGEPLPLVGRDADCNRLAKAKYPALYAKLVLNQSGEAGNAKGDSSAESDGAVTQMNLACGAISIDYPRDLRPCAELAKDPRYREYFGK